MKKARVKKKGVSTDLLFARAHQGEAVIVSRRLVEEEWIQSILLCPGFTHQNVAEIQDTVKGKTGVFVARGDDSSSIITRKARKGR